MLRRIKDNPRRKRLMEDVLSPLFSTAPCTVLSPVAGVVTALMLAVGTAPEAQAQPLQEAATNIVLDERADAAAPALSVLLMQDGAVLARVVDGMADPAQGVEAGIDTAFAAGSVTKVFTAALVMTEVDAGRLDLDAPIAPHVPPELRPVDATGAEVDVTLRQLLSHQSGLPVTWDGFPGLPPVESREAYIAGSRTLVYPPGARLVYSNVAFVLAGEIAAASAGMSFEELAQDRLFGPLGMTRTSLGHAANYAGPLAAGHMRAPDGAALPEPHLDLTPMAAAGSLLTTPEDLARFATMLLDGGVFERARILAVPAAAPETRPAAMPGTKMARPKTAMAARITEAAWRRSMSPEGGTAMSPKRVEPMPTTIASTISLMPAVMTLPRTRSANEAVALMLTHQNLFPGNLQ